MPADAALMTATKRADRRRLQDRIRELAELARLRKENTLPQRIPGGWVTIVTDSGTNSAGSLKPPETARPADAP
jgi:hypothetical protein